MKKSIAFAVLAALLVSAFTPLAADDELPTEAEASYAFGLIVGASLRDSAVTIDIDAFTKGLTMALQGLAGTMSREQAESIVAQAMDAARLRAGETQFQKEKAFFDENARREGVVTLPSGLQYKVVREGSGRKPGPGDSVMIHFRGTRVDGTVFDDTRLRGEALRFKVDEVIVGLAEDIRLMGLGGIYTFYIPFALAYGEQSAGSDIGPYETLIFEVELLDIGFIDNGLNEGDY